MDLGNVAQIISSLISAIALLVAIIGPRSRATAEAHSKLETRVVAIETEQATVRRDLIHLPDKESFHRIEMELQKLAGSIGVFDAQLKPVSATVNRIQDLLDEKVKL